MTVDPMVIVICCERSSLADLGRTATCLSCGKSFGLDAAVLVVRINGEHLGYVCPRAGCLSPGARLRWERRRAEWWAEA